MAIWKVRRKDGWHCSFCNAIIQKEHIDDYACPACGKAYAYGTGRRSSGSHTPTNDQSHTLDSSNKGTSGNGWVGVLGCLACLGAVVVLGLICVLAPKSDTITETARDKGGSDGWNMLVNTHGVVAPESRIPYHVKLDTGYHVAELIGGVGVLVVGLVKASSGDALPRTVLRDEGQLGRFRWKICKAGSYILYVENTSSDIKTDYIIKFWKGKWSY